MKIEDMPAGTELGWRIVTFIGIALATLVAVLSYFGIRRHERNELLARQLMSEFHKQFNSDDVSSPAYVKKIYSEVGPFRQAESCAITGYIEPPSLTVRCVSWFGRGKAEENFIFRDFGKDHSLLFYSATSSSREPANPEK